MEHRNALAITLLITLFVVMVSGGHDHFFQYANVPAWNAYEFGYNRGNHKHFTSRFEKAHGWTFKTKVRWGDKNGWGESYWDYNHGDKGWGKDHKKGHHHKGWGHHGSGSDLVETSVNPGLQRREDNGNDSNDDYYSEMKKGENENITPTRGNYQQLQRTSAGHLRNNQNNNNYRQQRYY